MNIQIIAVGKLQRMYRPIQEEFYKRLTRYAKIKEIEVPDEQAPEKLSAAQRAECYAGRVGKNPEEACT